MTEGQAEAGAAPVSAKERAAQVAAALQAAEHAHTAISARTGGADPDWPLFYAWWLLEWSELPELLGTTPTRSRLVYELVRLDREQRTVSDDTPWPRRYAEELLTLDWGN